jgi:hypothetical protein
MLEALKRLLSPEYLVVAEPGPMGSLWPLYAALGLIFAAGLTIALRHVLTPQTPHHPKTTPSTSTSTFALTSTFAWLELWICLAGLGTVVGRFVGWPGWSARIWPYSLAALALTGGLVYRFREWKLPAWLAEQVRVLSFAHLAQENAEARTRRAAAWLVSGLLVHLVGVGLVVTGRYGWPAWTAPLVLAALLLPQAPLLARRHPPRLMTLTPLLGAYATTALWLLYHVLGITVIGWQGLAFPNPMVSLFYVDGVILAAITYSILCQLHVILDVLGGRTALWRWAVAGLVTITLAWAGIVYLGKRTHGATASDPYAYAQMGIDLAENGTFLHRFSLFEPVIPLNIAWAPLQPVGYHIPRNSQGDSPSVWATGASVLLAAGYKLLGETGLYVTTPIVALLALAATWALIQEVLRNESRPVRYLAGAVTVALLATSPEYVDRILVPMADAPAQLFTVLTLLFVLRGMRNWGIGELGIGNWVLAGVCFGWAYWVRHTQLALVVAILLAMVLGRRRQYPIPNSQFPILTFFGAALLVALPDIVYRWQVFGGPLATETTELHAMGLQYIGPMAWQTLRDMLVAGEWGYLFPLALYGSYRLAHDHRRQAIVIGSALGGVLLVHLTYRFLRLRDLISIFPLVDLAVGYGAVALVRRIWALAKQRDGLRQLGPAVLSAVVIGWVILSLASARWTMIDNLWKRGWASFGYMRPENRAAFDRLAELTPEGAVVGASLNAGAVMMYTGRDAIRPYDSWTAEEWSIFLDAMHAEGRPVYLLDDGGLMATFIEAERSRHRLTPIAALEVPLFYTQDRDTGWLYRLEWEP